MNKLHLDNILRSRRERQLARDDEGEFIVDEDEFASDWERRMARHYKRHPEEIDELTAEFLETRRLRHPEEAEWAAAPKKTEPLVLKMHGDKKYTYKQFSDGSIEIVGTPTGRGVGTRYPAGSPEADTVADAVESGKYTAVAGFKETVTSPVGTAAIGAGLGYMLMGGPVGVLGGAALGWLLGK